jgi:tRNA (mo5U34)-methyltransferase
MKMIDALSDVTFYHTIDLPDGSTAHGPCDLRADPDYLGLNTSSRIKGSRVIDISANDGFWSFWAERAGASEVLAIDVETYDGYDWGYEGPPREVETFGQQDKSYAFNRLKETMGSSVRRESISCYKVDPVRHGEFDIVLFYGLLYHLRHPLLALDRARRVCRGGILLETHVQPEDPMLPSTLFYLDDVMDGFTNWTGPTLACITHWLKSAGFPHIFREKEPFVPGRARVLGAVDREWADEFGANPHFSYCDQQYFTECRLAVLQRLGRM